MTGRGSEGKLLRDVYHSYLSGKKKNKQLKNKELLNKQAVKITCNRKGVRYKKTRY